MIKIMTWLKSAIGYFYPNKSKHRAIVSNNIKSDIAWLYHEAMKCYEYGLKKSALLLLLCAVDSLAKQEYPGYGVGKRFQKYLSQTFQRYFILPIVPVRTKNGVYTGREEDEHFEEIGQVLYKFLRNPLVHEGKNVDRGVAHNVPVSIFWDSSETDPYPASGFGINGNYLIYALGCAVRDDIGLEGQPLEADALEKTWKCVHSTYKRIETKEE